MRRWSSASRIIALILLIISIVLSIGACNVFSKIKNPFSLNSNHISGQEMARLIILAIDDPDKIADAYSFIPEEQRAKVSYSNFYEYIGVLSSFSYQYGKVSSFRFLSEEENQKQLTHLYNRMCQSFLAEDFDTVFEKFGEVQTVELQYGTDEKNKGGKNVYIYLSEDENGVFYLSNEWIVGTLSVYNYMQHYFNMINSSNVEGVSGLLEESFKQTVSAEVVRARATYVIDFYHYKVRSFTSQFVLKEVNPFYIDYNIPQVLSDDGQSIYKRDISAVRDLDGDIKVIDEIPQETDAGISILGVNSSTFLRLGLEYSLDSLSRSLGQPLQVFVVSEEDKNSGKAIAVYKGVVLVLNLKSTDLSEDSDTNRLIGTLNTIRIIKDDSISYSICDIKLGDSEDKILKRFPMVEYGDYVLTYTDDKDNEYRVTYKVTGNMITAIRSSLVEK